MKRIVCRKKPGAPTKAQPEGFLWGGDAPRAFPCVPWSVRSRRHVLAPRLVLCQVRTVRKSPWKLDLPVPLDSCSLDPVHASCLPAGCGLSRCQVHGDGTHPGNVERLRPSRREGRREGRDGDSQGVGGRDPTVLSKEDHPPEAPARLPLLLGGALGTGVAARCEMIIFCFLPARGLMFSSSPEGAGWENIAALIPPCVRQKLPFYESPRGCVSVSQAPGAGRPLKHRALCSPNSLPSGSCRDTGLGFRGRAGRVGAMR